MLFQMEAPDGWGMLPARNRLPQEALDRAPVEQRETAAPFVFLTGCSRGPKWTSRLSNFGMGRMMAKGQKTGYKKDEVAKLDKFFSPNNALKGKL